MKRISGTLLAILAVGACAASTAALADNPAGFYLGAGVGYSTIRSDDSAYGLPGYFNDHQTAWKVITGVRPISVVGAEFEYIDFGQPSNHFGANSVNNYGLDSHPRAAALSRHERWSRVGKAANVPSRFPDDTAEGCLDVRFR